NPYSTDEVLSGWLQPSGQVSSLTSSEKVEAQRLHRRACAHFSAGMAAFWVRQVKTDGNAKTQFLRWLSRAARAQTQMDSGNISLNWLQGDVSLVLHACKELLAASDLTSVADACERVLFWLTPSPPQARLTFPIVTLNHENPPKKQMHDVYLMPSASGLP